MVKSQLWMRRGATGPVAGALVGLLVAACGGDDTTSSTSGEGGSDTSASANGGHTSSSSTSTSSNNGGGGASSSSSANGGGGAGPGGGGTGGMPECTTEAQCNDNDLCTTDSCDAGSCAHTPVSIDDADACTDDACDPGTGVSHTPVVTDDGDACTDDACDSTTGVSHTPTVIDDNDLCTTDACDSTSGVSHTPVVTDDNNLCTTDACDPSSGVSHTPIDRNDMNACTLDSCDPAIGPVNQGETVVFSEDFANNSKGWQLGTEWGIGSAVASVGGVSGGNDPATDHTPTADNGIAGAVIGGNVGTALHGFYYLTSPVIPLTVPASGFAELRLWRWLNADYNPYMHSVIEVFNGSTWTQIWSTANTITLDNPTATGQHGDGWFPMSFDVTAYANPNFQIRIGHDVASAGVFTIGGWNIDDVSVVTAAVATDNDQCTVLSCDASAGAVETPYNINDNNACTTDACTAEGPVHTAVAGIDDFNACTTDVCDPGSGNITHTPVNIDDGNPCTIDACNTFNGQITHTPKTADFTETFANNGAGWTLDPTWAIGPTVASVCGSDGQDPALDHSPSGDNGVAGVVLGGCVGLAQLNNPSVCVTSPPVNLTGEPGSVSVKYWRHLHSDYTPYMVNTVDVFNGSAYVNLFTTGGFPGVNDAAWTGVTFDVTAYKNANFRIRFCYDIQSSGVFNEASWSVDDVTVYDPACVTPL